MVPFKPMAQRKTSLWNSSEINTHLFRRNLPAFIPCIYTPPPALFFKLLRPCLSSNVIISRLKARWLIIVLYVALCLVSDSIHLCGHHFITFLVTEVKKINGNQITLLTERLKGQCVKFTVHHLSFKTFHFFYYLSLLLFIALSPEHSWTQSVALHLSSAEPSISATSRSRSGTSPAAPVESLQRVHGCYFSQSALEESQRTLIARLVLWSTLSYDIVSVVVFVIYCWFSLRSLLLCTAAVCPELCKRYYSMPKEQKLSTGNLQMKGVTLDCTGQNNRDRCRVVIHRELGGYCKRKCFEEQVGMEEGFESGEGCYVTANMLLFELSGWCNNFWKTKGTIRPKTPSTHWET